MNNANVIHVRIRSTKQMEALGQSFGLHFLRPLVESGVDTANRPVVALYGPSGTGKTTFARNVAKQFPWLKPQLKPSSRYGIFSAPVIEVDIPSLGSHLYRHHDFAYVAPAGFVPSENYFAFSPRQAICETSQPGFDILEHAHGSHFKDAQIVVLLTDREHDNYYFQDLNKMILSAQNLNSEAHNVWNEMCRPMHSALSRDNERIVSIFLASKDSFTLQAFTDFGQRVRSNRYILSNTVSTVQSSYRQWLSKIRTALTVRPMG